MSMGIEEILPPYIVNRDSLIGTGQLPKFEEDLFKLEDTDYFLIPTAEVPVTNYHREEILTAEDLPQYFRRLQRLFPFGSRICRPGHAGLIRQHQFNKVELVKLVTPEDSYEELENAHGHAERVLQLLELPYRVLTLCTGDMGFASAKTYDLEVWLPSGSTTGKFRPAPTSKTSRRAERTFASAESRRRKPEFVHTLNGSGLAVGRTVAAILENYQQADGTVVIPEVLRPYMGGTCRNRPLGSERLTVEDPLHGVDDNLGNLCHIALASTN